MPTLGTTTNNSFRYPTDANNGVDYSIGIADLASDVDGMWRAGTLAARPAANAVTSGTRYRCTDTGQISLSNGTIWMDLGGFAPPLVTSLPGSPYDGQVIFFQAAVGVNWQLRYNAASGSTFKWEFVGGAPLVAQVAIQDSTASTSYTDLSNIGPQLTLPTLPNGGDFDIEIGALASTLQSTVAPSVSFMSYQIGATPAADADAVENYIGSTGSIATEASVARTQRKAALAGGQLITAKYKVFAGGTVPNDSFANRFLRISPVRVG